MPLANGSFIQGLTHYCALWVHGSWNRLPFLLYTHGGNCKYVTHEERCRPPTFLKHYFGGCRVTSKGWVYVRSPGSLWSYMVPWVPLEAQNYKFSPKTDRNDLNPPKLLSKFRCGQKTNCTYDTLFIMNDSFLCYYVDKTNIQILWMLRLMSAFNWQSV